MAPLAALVLGDAAHEAHARPRALTGGASLVLLFVAAVVDRSSAAAGRALGWAAFVAFGAVPLAILAGILRSRLAGRASPSSCATSRRRGHRERSAMPSAARSAIPRCGSRTGSPRLAASSI